jgi:AraC-like DNA-binding protein
MTAVAALLDSRAARLGLRRSLPRGIRLHACRSERDLPSILQHQLVEAIVLGTWFARRVDVAELRKRFPTIPIVVLGLLRAEDAGTVLEWEAGGIIQVLIEGVDDVVAGELVLRNGASRRRQANRADLPRALRLTEPLQRRVWELMARSPGRPPRPAALARTLGVSREHLSRQFGAGGAPNLKPVSDLLTVQVTLELLGNPGYDIGSVARLLDFSGPSHLRTTVRRIAGVGLAEARRLEWREVVRRFVKANRE